MKRKPVRRATMAGRHGNKGRDRPDPAQEIPTWPDGAPVRDRAQPARRALEKTSARSWRRTWAGPRRPSGSPSRDPVFDGASETEIKELLEKEKRASRAQPARPTCWERQDHPRRRHDREPYRAEGEASVHLHAEAVRTVKVTPARSDRTP